jgi:hypothetical protein
MSRRGLAVSLACAALVVWAALAAATPPARAAGVCTQTWRYFRIDHLDLHETISDHFVDTDDGHDNTTIDTVERADVSQAVPRPPAAKRRKAREIAFFYELVSGCRVGDLNLGFLGRTVTVPYTLAGTWTTTGKTGTCGERTARQPTFSGTFMRPTRSRVFYPPPSRVALQLTLNDHARLDCRYDYPSDSGVGYDEAGLGSWYPMPSYAERMVMPAATLLRGRVVRIPFHFGVHSKGTWLHGTMTSQADTSGSLTLRRYKSCTLLPSTPLNVFCLP